MFRSLTHERCCANWREGEPKSNFVAVVIQTPTSTSEISEASEPVQYRGSGRAATTIAPATGRKIRSVVSQLNCVPSTSAGRHEDDGEDREPARQRERVGAHEAVLRDRELTRAEPERAGNRAHRARDQRTLDERVERAR